MILREVNMDFRLSLSQTNACLGARKSRPLAGNNGRATATLPHEFIADDPVTEYEVEKAIRRDGGWEVSFDDGLTGFFTTDEPIKAGDTLGLYTGGRAAMGSMRHGFEKPPRLLGTASQSPNATSWMADSIAPISR